MGRVNLLKIGVPNFCDIFEYTSHPVLFEKALHFARHSSPRVPSDQCFFVFVNLDAMS